MGLLRWHSRFCTRCDKAVNRWHARRCPHYALVLSDMIATEVLAAGKQMYRNAKIAYDLSRKDELPSLGQRDSMNYALRRWERATFSRDENGSGDA